MDNMSDTATRRHGDGRLRLWSLSVYFIIFLTPCLIVSLSPCLTAEAAEQKTAMTGTLSNVDGTVEIMKRGTRDWVQATSGMSIGTGDQISTGIDGKATLKFANTATDIKPLTSFTVGPAMESAGEFKTDIYLQVGKLVTKADKNSGKTNRFSVTTPSAVAGIRGTTQDVSYDEAFGTVQDIEDGEGSQRPIDVDQLPPAIQMCLGAGQAADAADAAEEKAEAKAAEKEEKAEEKEEKAEAKAEEKAEGGAPEELVTAGEAAASADVGAPADGAGADVSAALDQWLDASFDNQVAGEEKAGGEEGAPAPEAAPEIEGEAPPVPMDMEAAFMGEEIIVGDGQTCEIPPDMDVADLESIIDPAAAMQEEATTEVLPTGTTDAEEEASLISTEVSDVPASLESVENLTSDEATQDLYDYTIYGDYGDANVTPTQTDLFGNPPPTPDN